MSNSLKIVLLIALLAGSIGCAGAQSGLLPSGGSLNYQQASASSPHEFCWGLFDITIDPATCMAEITPIRGSAFEANVTKFLQPPSAPVNLFTIHVRPESNFPAGHVVLDVSIKHPFPGTNLRGFDVLGIFMPPEGQNRSTWDASITYPSENGARLLNADGYSRWWNQTEFTTYGKIFGYQEGVKATPGFQSICTLNPYKYFADGLEADTPITADTLKTMTSRGSFATQTPGLNTRRYDVQFPVPGSKPDFRFKYAITSSYWGPDPGSPTPAPVDDYPLSANRAEAALIVVRDAGSTAYFANESTFGGDLTFDLEILDWKGMVDSSGAISEIGGVYAESPTLFSGVVNLLDTATVVSNPFDPALSLLSCTIPDVTPSGLDNQSLLIIVTSASPTDYSVQIPGITGFDYPGNAVLAAFQIWEAPISPNPPQPNLPPIADASKSAPLSGSAPLTVNFDPSLSYDPDGTIVSYEWDFENDGSFDYTTVAPDIVPHDYPAKGVYEAQLRVTDDDGASDMLDQPLKIHADCGGDPKWEIMPLPDTVNVWMTAIAFNQNDYPVAVLSPNEGDTFFRFYEWNGSGWDMTKPFAYGDSGSNSFIGICYSPSWDLAAAYSNIHWNGGDRDTDFWIRKAGETTWSMNHVDTDYCGGYSVLIHHDGKHYGVVYNKNDNTEWYAYGDPGSWATEPIGPASGNAWADFAFDSSGNPYAVSNDNWGATPIDIWYRLFGIWHKHPLGEPVSHGAAISSGTGGQMYVAYFTDNDLKLATGSEDNWSFETLAYGVVMGTADSMGGVDIATDSIGYPHIAFRDNSTNSVSYIYKDGSGWHQEIIDSEWQYPHVSIALDSCDRPAIAYLNSASQASMNVAWFH